MRKSEIHVHDILAGILEETPKGYRFIYLDSYLGPPVSLTMPITQQAYVFEEFPSFFEGLLPEGPQLEALLRQEKLDRKDYFGQLVVVGQDLVGAVTVTRIE